MDTVTQESAECGSAALLHPQRVLAAREKGEKPERKREREEEIARARDDSRREEKSS